MSTTDKPTWQLAEQICEVPAVDEAIRTFVEDNTSDNAIGLVLAVLDYQAATEAAKATGTALYGCGFGCKCTATFQHGECNADHSELSFKVKNPICQKCKGTGEQDSGGVYPWGEGINVPCDCEAARQPAPVTIKTWQERQVSEGGMQNPGYKMWGERFYMVEEIADLRAALAATAAPVLSDEQLDEIWEKLDGAEIIKSDAIINWDRALRRAYARKIIAATRSQP